MKSLREIVGTKPLNIDVPLSPSSDDQRKKEQEFISHMTKGAVAYDLPWKDTDYSAGVKKGEAEGPRVGLMEPALKLEELEAILDEAIETLDDDEFEVFLEELENIDELSKKTLTNYIVKSAEKVDTGKDKTGRRRKGLEKAYSSIGKKSVREDVEEIDEISRDTLSRYIQRTKDDPKRDKGRNLALKKNWGDKRYGFDEPRVKATPHAIDVSQKKVSEDVEQVDELEKKTLQSYIRKAKTSAERHNRKGDQEEDKAMSTDGYKYPEKQARHQRNASNHFRKWQNRMGGIGRASDLVKQK